MSVISRLLPNSNVSRQNALANLEIGIDGAPVGTVVLPADVTTDLPLLKGNYSIKYLAVEGAEGASLLFIGYRKKEFIRLSTVTLDFLKVVRISVNRSVVFGNGSYEEADLNFYNLDETGNNLPVIYTDEDAMNWANSVVNGEIARLAANPASSGMTNPLSTEVAAQKALLVTARTNVSVKNQLLSEARAVLNLLNPTVDIFIKRAWDFLEANFSYMEAPAKRSRLREFGVVYISRGAPNMLTFLVKDINNLPLAEAVAVVEESGGDATANVEGRILITTQLVGLVHIVIQYPGKQKNRIEFEISEDAEDQTFTLPDVILEDNI